VMPRKMMPDRILIRASIGLVWLYEGLWCKVLERVPRHEAVLASAPFIGHDGSRTALAALGLVECAIALWVWSGWRLREAAIVQTVLLIAMNTGGLVWAAHLIPDPGSMIVQNFAFLVLIWIAAEDPRYAAQA
jgi:hypothetical protein